MTVGSLSPNPNLVVDAYPRNDMTAIGFSNGASGPGYLTNAVFQWSASPCPRTVKIKFFRTELVGEGRQAPVEVLVAERGPFDVNSLTQSVLLLPPVAVQAGDVIAVARVTACGNPVGQTPTVGAITAYSGDLTGIVAPGAYPATLYHDATLSAQATGTVNPPPLSLDSAAIVPVVGSTPGAGGQAFFRSSVQLHNPRSTPLSGHLIYHRQGVSGTPMDPSLVYALQSGETRSIPDLLTALNLTGLGSLDIVPDVTLPAPLVLVRVFNDAGPSGTSGFTEEPALPAEVLGAGQKGTLIAPSDPLLFRFNIGVRTLSAGATLAITVRAHDGQPRETFTRSYPPNYMEQTSAGRFTFPDEPSSGIFPPLDSDDSVTIEVTAGNAIVYGATVDNRTKDPSVQLAIATP